MSLPCFSDRIYMMSVWIPQEDQKETIAAEKDGATEREKAASLPYLFWSVYLTTALLVY